MLPVYYEVLSYLVYFYVSGLSVPFTGATPYLLYANTILLLEQDVY